MKKPWTDIVADKCFDDQNEGHNYQLANRFIVYAWHFPKGEGRYGRRGFNQNDFWSK
jgi:hypothetical protein